MSSEIKVLHGEIWMAAAWGHLQSQSWASDLTPTLNIPEHPTLAPIKLRRNLSLSFPLAGLVLE